MGISKSKVRSIAIQFVLGVEKYLPKKTVVVAGVTYHTGDVVKTVRAHLQTIADAQAAKNAWKQRVIAEKQAKRELFQLLNAFRAFVAGQFGASSLVLGEFGFEPRKVSRRSALSKAVAVAKSRETRQKTKGTVTSAAARAQPTTEEGTQPKVA